MEPVQTSLIVFAFSLGGALVGGVLRARLPGHHLDHESREAVMFGVGLVATMTALVLGLITASAKSSFDAVDADVKQMAVDILTIDRLLARYGPETDGIRAALKEAIGRRTDLLWGTGPNGSERADPMAVGAASEAERLVDAIRGLAPRDASQRALRARAIDVAEGTLRSRWQVFATGEATSVPMPFLVIVIFWLAITFAAFGLFAPRNATVLAMLVACALSVGSAVFLILELDRPFEGMLRVPVEPMRYVEAHLDR